MAVQTERYTVEISWTAPSVPPVNGYLITPDISDITNRVLSPPYTTRIPSLGVYNIRVKSLSQHLPGGTVELQFSTSGEL